MRVLIDTNVMLDFMTARAPFFSDAKEIMNLCKQERLSACIAAHSVMNVFYILRKDYTLEQRREMLMKYCQLVSVEEINKGLLINALKRKDFRDVEDCLQDECAVSFHADYIVTRNVSDFMQSKIKAISPEEFLKLFGENER